MRELCAGFDDDYWARCDREHEFPWDFYARMAEGGWLGLAIPEEYGGGGRGITDAAVMLHEIAASGAAMNGCSAVHLTVFGLNPVVKFGNDRLKEAFLPRAAAGELHVAFGVTEPDAGTDTGRISTRAEPDGKGGWRIHGRKVWTTKALESEVVLLIARTGEKDSGLQGPQPVPRRPRPRLRRHPRHPQGRAQRGRVVRGRVRRPAGRAVAARRRGERGLQAAAARAQPGTHPPVVGGVRDRRGRARPRRRLRQGTDRVQPADRRQPGDQPSARPARTRNCGPRG